MLQRCSFHLWKRKLGLSIFRALNQGLCASRRCTTAGALPPIITFPLGLRTALVTVTVIKPVEAVLIVVLACLYKTAP